jgi:glutathione S-transferase
MFKLYHTYLSVCAQKARLGLEEKGLKWESQYLNLQRGEHQTPEYLKLNPKGVVPTLIHDGRVVRESNIIIEYLDEVQPTPPLRPADPYGRAMMHLWMKRLDDGHHDVATATISQGIVFRHWYLAKGPEEVEKRIQNIPDPVKRERRRDVMFNGVKAREFGVALTMWKKAFEDMEEALTENEWLVGNSYTLADLAWVPYLVRIDHLSMLGLLDKYPKVARWYDRVRERPAFERAIQKWAPDHEVTDARTRGAEVRDEVKAQFATL